MYKYTPFFINLKGKKCVVAGGGKIAERKIESLLEAEGDIVCITKEVISNRIAELAACNKIKLIIKEIEIQDFENAFIIIAATNVEAINKKIFNEYKDKNVLINCVDDVLNSNFIYPAVLKRGLLKIAVSTSGAAPVLASVIRDKIGEIISEDIEEIIVVLKSAREKAFTFINNGKERGMFFKKIAGMVKINEKNDIVRLKESIEEEIEKTK